MDGCTNVQHGKGVCRPHYMKCWRGQLDWPEYTRPPEPTVEQRFWQKVDKRQPDECWPWMASMLRNGYGQFDHTTAHRFAMTASGFDVGPDEVVDHLCRNRGCVNPAHLVAVRQGSRADAVAAAAAGVRAPAPRSPSMEGDALSRRLVFFLTAVGPTPVGELAAAMEALRLLGVARPEAHLAGVPGLAALVDQARADLRAAGLEPGRLEAELRYGWIGGVLARSASATE